MDYSAHDKDTLINFFTNRIEMLETIHENNKKEIKRLKTQIKSLEAQIKSLEDIAKIIVQGANGRQSALIASGYYMMISKSGFEKVCKYERQYNKRIKP